MRRNQQSMQRRPASYLMAVILSIVACCAARADQSPQKAGRLSDARGEVSVRGQDEDDVSVADPNCVIRTGDMLWTDQQGNAEIELPGGLTVRLAEDTKLEVRQL